MKRLDLSQWDDAVQAWRRMRRSRPLGINYTYPSVDLPPSLMIAPNCLVGGYPSAFLVLDRIAGGRA